METSMLGPDRIGEAMDEVQGTGVFAVQGDLNLPDPGLVVEGLGAVPTPIRAADARKLIGVARQAPFGRGTETLVDTSVRRCWELDPERFRLTAEDWPDFEKILAGGVAYEFGFSEPLFEASLYKLLVYEKGSFFLPHQDGEKLDAMVATLVVTLPGAFTGGELVVQHQGSELICPATAAAEGTSASYAAFYSDCRHEVRELRSGYRVALVYNLSVNNAAARRAGISTNLTAAMQTEATARLTQLLGQWSRDVTDADAARPRLIALPLEHQYSPAGLSLDTLKGNDRLRVQVIAAAAEEHDLVAYVCLLKWHQSGAGNYADGHWPEREYSRHRRYREYDEYEEDEYDEDNGFDEPGEDEQVDEPASADDVGPQSKPSPYEMEEVYEESLDIEHWLDIRTGRRVELGPIPIEQESIADADTLEHWLRTREDFEGYTGNAGMTLERWYSRAAVVLWPRRVHFQILTSAGTDASLAGLQEMVAAARRHRGRRRQQELAECAAFGREIIDRWKSPPHHFSFGFSPFDGEASDRESPNALLLFAEIEDLKLLNHFLLTVPMQDPHIDLTGYPKAAKQFGWDASVKEMQQVFERNESASLRQNLAALSAIVADEDRLPKKSALAARLAESWLRALKQHHSGKEAPAWSRERLDRKAVMIEMITLCLEGRLDRTLEEFLSHALAHLQRYDLRDVQAAALQELQSDLDGDAAKRLRPWLEQLEKHFESLTRQPPAAPSDWRRGAAIGCSCADCRRVAAFLHSATEKVLELPAPADRRGHLHRQIETQGLDLTHVTRRSGRPYVLVCTKTNATYDRAVQTYHSDLEALQIIRKLK